MAIKLVPMSQAEYDRWAPLSLQNYAEGKMRANRLSRREAEKLAAESFKQVLPDGLGSRNCFLFVAKDEHQSSVGSAWYAIQVADDPKAYIYDLRVEDEHRGKGYGRQIMLLLEKDMKQRGIGRVGLHVFGFNEIAIGLYRSLGFETTGLLMEKDLYAPSL